MSDEDLAGTDPIGLTAVTLRARPGATRPQPIGQPDVASILAARYELELRGRLEAFAAIEESRLPAVMTTGGSQAVAPSLHGHSLRVGEIDDVSVDTSVANATPPRCVPTVRPPFRDEALAPLDKKSRLGPLAALMMCALVATVGWRFMGVSASCQISDPRPYDMAGRLAPETLASRIVTAESNGDASAKNGLSSASGAGQFLDATWLEIIRGARPDLAGRTEAEILGLRRDPELSREMVARFAERNAAMLVTRCLRPTPGTLYLSHFAGGAGAVAVLLAPENADAAATMAKADSTGRTTREAIVAANPFLASFTVADLKRWADRKMSGTGDQVRRLQ